MLPVFLEHIPFKLFSIIHYYKFRDAKLGDNVLFTRISFWTYDVVTIVNGSTSIHLMK